MVSGATLESEGSMVRFPVEAYISILSKYCKKYGGGIYDDR